MSEIYRGAWVVAYLELLRFVVDRSRIISSLAFPLLFLAIFGAGFGNVVGAMAGGVDLLQFMYPGILAQSVVLTALVAGILIASFLRSQQGFQLLVQVLVFPLVFLAGVFFPVDTVPWWMQVLSKVNPVTYGVDAIRQVFLGSGPAGAGLGVTVLGHTMAFAEEVALIGGLAVVLLAGAAWAFGRQE